MKALLVDLDGSAGFVPASRGAAILVGSMVAAGGVGTPAALGASAAGIGCGAGRHRSGGGFAGLRTGRRRCTYRHRRRRRHAARRQPPRSGYRWWFPRGLPGPTGRRHAAYHRLNIDARGAFHGPRQLGGLAGRHGRRNCFKPGGLGCLGRDLGLAASCGAANTGTTAKSRNSVAVLMKVPRMIPRPAMRPALLAKRVRLDSLHIVYSIAELNHYGSRTPVRGMGIQHYTSWVAIS